VMHAYAFKCDEHGFARALLGARTQLWLYRCNQRAACGDFVVVDVSPPWPRLRTAWVLELKRSAVLRFGAGGVQLADAEGARAQLVRDGVLDPDRPLLPILGQGPEILDWFGV
jgi:hypothetical protein